MSDFQKAIEKLRLTKKLVDLATPLSPEDKEKLETTDHLKNSRSINALLEWREFKSREREEMWSLWKKPRTMWGNTCNPSS